MASNFNPNLSHHLPNLPNPHQTKPEKIESVAAAGDAKLVINGGSKLSGHVSISGSKNSALSVLAATLCCSGTSKLTNVPDLSDTRTMASILASLGAEVEFSNHEVVVNADRVGSVEPDPARIAGIRGGFFVVGPLLARFGEACPVAVTLGPGPLISMSEVFGSSARWLKSGRLQCKMIGCNRKGVGIAMEVKNRGERMVNWDNKAVAHAANGRGLVGGSFELDYPSVGATQTLIMAASMAQGKTILSNVSREPEIVDLVSFLSKAGVCIEGAGTNTICIYGRKQLLGTQHEIMPDRIETGTFMLAAAITRSCISISPVVPCWLSCLIDKLSGAGCKITHEHNTLELSAICGSCREDLQGFDMKTLPYPGFPTDLQPPTMAMLSTCKGLSIVEETVFENRMTHVKELQKLGARIHAYGSGALIHGKGKAHKLCGTGVDVVDLRGGISLVLAGLAAEGVTQVSGVSYIERGYENLEMKLQLLGAHVKRLDPIPSPN